MADINQLDTAFTKKYETEVHTAFQNKGGELRRCVRLKTGIIGKSTTFQKVGKGTASQKTRKGLVPIMNIEHGNVECLLEDWFAADYIDGFDELKIQHNERKVVAEAGGYALGRKSNEMIITNLQLATQTVGDYSTALTKALVSKAIKTLNAKKVTDDGMRFAALTPNAWEHFININEVKNADFADKLYPWLKGTEAIYWRKVVWQQIGDLPGEGTSQEKCYLWHQTAVGCAEAAGVTTEATWENDHDSWFVKNKMSEGACLIDSEGVVEIRVNGTIDIS